MEALPLTEYLMNLNLIESPLAVIAVLAVSCAAHFTLFKFLLQFLAATDPSMGRDNCIERYRITQKSQRILSIIGITGVVGTTLIIMYWLLSGLSNTAVAFFCDFTIAVSPLMIAIHIVSLAYMHLFISMIFFRFEQQRVGQYLSFARCTIKLKNGTELRGGLIDLVKDDNQFRCELYLPNGKTKVVASDRISSVRLDRTEAETKDQVPHPDQPNTVRPAVDDAAEVNREFQDHTELWGTNSDRPPPPPTGN